MSKKQAALAFEAEMDNELEEILETKQKPFLDLVKPKESEKSILKNVQASTSSSASQKKEEDEEESDTDSEAELETGVRTKKKRKHFTNDELFYDPDADDQDAKWASEMRSRQSAGPTSGTTQLKSILKKTPQSTTQKPVASTDAVLNCPCCMSMLTMDCQRHERYNTQYRAMLVFNCKIREDEQLKVAKTETNNKKRQQKQTPIEFETFKPVYIILLLLLRKEFSIEKIYSLRSNASLVIQKSVFTIPIARFITFLTFWLVIHNQRN